MPNLDEFPGFAKTIFTEAIAFSVTNADKF